MSEAKYDLQKRFELEVEKSKLKEDEKVYMKKIIVLMILICVATPLYAQSKSTDKVVVQQTKSKTEIDQQIEKLNIRIDSISIAHNQATNKEEKDTKNISNLKMQNKIS